MAKSFYDYFSENMKALNLPAPESLFGSITTATGSIGAMVKYVQTYGTKATVREMLMTLPGAVSGAGGGAAGYATAASEALLVIGAVSAAYYVGACLGSLAVATTKAISTEVSIADCLSTALAYRIDTPFWLLSTLATNPVLLARHC